MLVVLLYYLIDSNFCWGLAHGYIIYFNYFVLRVTILRNGVGATLNTNWIPPPLLRCDLLYYYYCSSTTIPITTTNTISFFSLFLALFYRRTPPQLCFHFLGFCNGPLFPPPVKKGCWTARFCTIRLLVVFKRYIKSPYKFPHLCIPTPCSSLFSPVI